MKVDWEPRLVAVTTITFLIQTLWKMISVAWRSTVFAFKSTAVERWEISWWIFTPSEVNLLRLAEVAGRNRWWQDAMKVSLQIFKRFQCNATWTALGDRESLRTATSIRSILNAFSLWMVGKRLWKVAIGTIILITTSNDASSIQQLQSDVSYSFLMLWSFEGTFQFVAPTLLECENVCDEKCKAEADPPRCEVNCLSECACDFKCRAGSNVRTTFQFNFLNQTIKYF